MAGTFSGAVFSDRNIYVNREINSIKQLTTVQCCYILFIAKEE